jgi:hypothetical protein
MGIITRQVGSNAKGSSLTYAEMDDNLIYLDGKVTGSSGYMAVFSGSNAVSKSLIYQTGSQIGINTVTFNRATEFSRDDTASYIVAKWVPDTDYDIETGVLKQNRPIVDEYFYPDLSLRDGKFYRTATSTIPLNLPYLSGEGLSGRGSSNPKGVDYTTQDPNFKEGVMPFGELNQTDWPSCRYRPDQSLSSPVFERCA